MATGTKTTIRLRGVAAAFVLAVVATCPAARGGFFYDRPYPDIEWLVHETEHFRVYYYAGEEWTARRVAKWAERAYGPVTELFSFPLKEKINIVVRDQEDYSNGWAAYNFDQITMWATPLYYVLRGRQDWIPDALTHEFTHIVSLKANSWKSEGALLVLGQGLVEDGVHDVDVGVALMIGWNTPWFWSEGVAEYGTHLAGYNWWTTSRDMLQRMSMLEDNYLDYAQLFNRRMAPSSFDGERGYQQGYTMALYVMEKYGRRKWAELALNSARKGHLQWDLNFRDVLGVSGEELFEGWLAWMKKRYEAQAKPILEEEHLGVALLPPARGGWPEVVERGADRWKVRLWPQRCVPAEMLEKANREKLAKLAGVSPEELEKLDAAGLAGFVAGHFAEPDRYEKLIDRFEELASRYRLRPPRIEFWNKKRRKLAYESGGQWHMYPRQSPDGRWFALAKRRELLLQPIELEKRPSYSSLCLDGDTAERVSDGSKRIRGASSFLGYDFSPDGRQVVFSAIGCPNTRLPCVSLDGYYRMDLFLYDIESEDLTRISKRLRAMMPAFSPDGRQIAFVHVEDGQNHLGLIPEGARNVRPDGSCTLEGKRKKDCIRWLIRRHDGTLLGQPSFSPDGKRLVIDLYRNGRQDVWLVDIESGRLRPLTFDEAEDRDARFTPDGKAVVFSSDRSGIFNVYRLDLGSGRLVRLTNVVGGAFTPFLTESGDLLYSYFTSYGLKPYLLKKTQFYGKEERYTPPPPDEEIARWLGEEEQLPDIAKTSDDYNPFSPSNWAPPVGMPMVIYERRGLQAGGQLLMLDALDKHMLAGTVLLGQESLYSLRYYNNFWYPRLQIGWTHMNLAYEFAQGFTRSATAESRSEAHFPPPVGYKNRQTIDFGFGGFDWPLARRLKVKGRYLYRHMSSRRASGTKDQAFLTNNRYTIGLEYDDLPRRGPEFDVNPTSGRRISVEYGFVRTGLPRPDWADVEWLGRVNPPGDGSDDYRFHMVQFGYTEYLPVTWWNPDYRHTLELHLRAGFINRNVHRWDEFFAGSLHPMRYVPTFSTTHEFAGYEDFSLRGETMLILGLTYRFPLLRRIDFRAGPFFVSGLWVELSATAGNLWGYTAQYVLDRFGNIDRNPESYWDPAVVPGTIRRERPFLDMSSKNGNYMLYDLSVTFKLKAYMFGVQRWNSFVRVSYAFNDIVGQYEVNDDYTYVDAYPNNALYAELEPKGIRVFVGIGTDFD